MTDTGCPGSWVCLLRRYPPVLRVPFPAHLQHYAHRFYSNTRVALPLQVRIVDVGLGPLAGRSILVGCGATFYMTRTLVHTTIHLAVWGHNGRFLLCGPDLTGYLPDLHCASGRSHADATPRTHHHHATCHFLFAAFTTPLRIVLDEQQPPAHCSLAGPSTTRYRQFLLHSFSLLR